MMYLDILIQNHIVGIRTASITEWMYLASRLFDMSWEFCVLVALVALLVYLLRGKSCMALFLFSLAFAAGTVGILKFMFNVSRPLDYVVSAFGKSFPSYHATIATVFFGILMYVFDGGFSKPTRILFNALCIFSILFVSFSRVYLGAHWFSDVVCGIILGALVSYLAVLVFTNVTGSVRYRRGNASMIK
jgi:undecaprenyl-diphosphatase